MSAQPSHPSSGGGSSNHSHATSNQRKRRHPQADVQPRGTSASAAVGGGGSSSSSVIGFGTGGPRTLHVLEFAEARAREIASLTHILSASVGGATANTGVTGAANPAQISGGGRRVFQSLPRHMRRRAMSHNIHRLPHRLQGAAKREMDKIEKSAPPKAKAKASAAGEEEDEASVKRPSRRTRRRPRNILAMHAHRMAQHQWLETHVWHAKRMYMENAWLYRMAIRPTDRSLRACYNANVHLATVFDASASQVLALHAADVATIAAVMRRFIPLAQWHQLQSAELVSGHREGELHLHHAGAAPYGFVASIKYQWQGVTAATPSASTIPQQCHLWLWVHPSVYSLVQSMLEAVSSASSAAGAVSVEPLLGQLCRIELRGHRCQAVLRMAIRAIEEKNRKASPAAATMESKDNTDMTDVDASADEAASISTLLTAYVSPALFPAHAIYALQAQHPEKLNPPPSQPFEFRDGADREKAKGTILPKRNNTFSQSTDRTMAQQLSKSHHAQLYAEVAQAAPLFSPLFDAEFRRRHTRETAWGAKKQRYNRIAKKELERKRKMHARRDEEYDAAQHRRREQHEEDEAAMSDTTTVRRTKQSVTTTRGTKPLAPKIRSKDDLDVGSSSTPLPTSQPLVAPLTNQPYILLIQQPGSNVQCTRDTPKTHVGSPAHSLGSGWDIVCSAGWATLFWKALIYSGARAIGHADRSRFRHEQGWFDDRHPIDAPDSHAGQIATLHRERTRLWYSDRIPANKKPNYHRNHVAHPFAQPFFELLELGAQKELAAQYEPLIRNKHPTIDEQADATDDEANESNKKQKTAATAKTTEKTDDVEMTDSVASAAAKPPASIAKPDRKAKHKARPESEPPYELMPVPSSFAHRHLPFYVWREWRDEFDAARRSNADLTLAAFFALPSTPSLANVLLPVSLRCPSGGQPEDDAFICAPLPDEWRRFRTQTPAPPCTDSHASHNERHAKPPAWDVLHERNNHIHTTPHPLRPNIGTVLHGWFSYQRGCGVGLGFVAGDLFIQLLTRQQADEPPQESASADAFGSSSAVWVWTRNQNSLTYRAAQVQLA